MLLVCWVVWGCSSDRTVSAVGTAHRRWLQENVFVVRWVLNLVYKVIRGRNFWAQEYGSNQILLGRSNERKLDERGVCSTRAREKRDMN